jgi:L-aspartate oxidase
VYLDARHVPDLTERFPTITGYCRAAGVDPTVDLIPVAPAAHYASGGVQTDLSGRTTIEGLYACGEVACTGVHGANRLASNSLLEGLVFSRRIAADLTKNLAPQGDPVLQGGGEFVAAGPETALARHELQRAMTRGAGVLRSAESLSETAEVLQKVGHAARDWELDNLLTVAAALVGVAQARRETRGCHWREDFPADDPAWQGHLIAGVDASGALTQTWEAMA